MCDDNHRQVVHLLKFDQPDHQLGSRYGFLCVAANESKVINENLTYSSLGGNLDALKDGFGHVDTFQGCWIYLGPEEIGGEDVHLFGLFVCIAHLKLLAGELTVNEKHFFFPSNLLGQLGGKKEFPGVGTGKEDGVFALYYETVAILLGHRRVL